MIALDAFHVNSTKPVPIPVPKYIKVVPKSTASSPHGEGLWLSVKDTSGDLVTGRVATSPSPSRHYRKHDLVLVTRDCVHDWATKKKL
jgi:hypothetical protein